MCKTICYLLILSPALILMYGNRLLELYLHLDLLIRTYNKSQAEDVEFFESYRLVFLVLMFAIFSPTIIFYSGLIKTLYEQGTFEKKPQEKDSNWRTISRTGFLTFLGLPFILIVENLFHIQ